MKVIFHCSEGHDVTLWFLTYRELVEFLQRTGATVTCQLCKQDWEVPVEDRVKILFEHRPVDNPPLTD